MTTDGLSRRHALTGAAAVGLGGPLLAACAADDEPTTADDPGPSGSTSSDPDAGGEAPGAALASTSEIEVGGGTIFADQKVVVTQPSEGEFKGFSSTCTHQGCQVASVSDGTINCPCHGSQFSIEDGSVAGGPAPGPLSAVELNVQGGEISLA
jgi:Rieske Fe-S protein